MHGFTRSWTLLLSLGTLAACDTDPVGQALADRAPVTASEPSLDVAADTVPIHRQIAILDDCDPRDPGWAPTGGCTRIDGKVTLAEFNAYLTSPLSVSAVGHPSWRNEPSYTKMPANRNVRVTNHGGRLHTFTPVAAFGGGRVPPLNVGLTPAPECQLPAGSPDPWAVTPGASLDITGLAPGNYRYQCCIHPWMVALVKVL